MNKTQLQILSDLVSIAHDKYDGCPSYRDDLECFDRLLAEIKAEIVAEAKSAPGNAAALREAVVALLSWVDDHCQIGAFDEGSTKEDIRREWDALNAAKDSVRAALAAPVRNVDRFATLDEARQAFQEMRGHRILADVELWDSMDEAGAFARWLFAPAEGGDHA